MLGYSALMTVFYTQTSHVRGISSETEKTAIGSHCIAVAYSFPELITVTSSDFQVVSYMDG